MIELVVFDIDGVITDGTVIVDPQGREQKQVNLKDIDAVYELHRRGYRLAAITGEDTEIVSYFEKRFPWECFYRGKKAKEEALRQIGEQTGIPRERTCYVGDGKYDVGALSYAGLGICPADAIGQAKQAADIILQQGGGQGCLWELVPILEEYHRQGDVHRYFCQRLFEHACLFKKLAADTALADTVLEVGERMVETFRAGGGIYLCGNGGSAADAQHIATEFTSRFYRERPGLNAEALTVNTSALTAIGNDYSFKRVFARQLEAKAKAGDMVVGITTSGESENVLEALRYARGHGLTSVLLTGGAQVPGLEGTAAYRVQVPSLDTPRIQEAHIFIGHVLAEYVEQRMFG